MAKEKELEIEDIPKYVYSLCRRWYITKEESSDYVQEAYLIFLQGGSKKAIYRHVDKLRKRYRRRQQREKLTQFTY